MPGLVEAGKGRSRGLSEQSLEEVRSQMASVCSGALNAMLGRSGF